MVFKQKILKMEIIKFFSVIISVFIVNIIILIIGLMQKASPQLILFFMLVFFLPFFVLIVAIGLNNLEWFYVYNNRIEVRCVYGKKNIVYFKNIIFVREIKINLTARGTKKTFYIFNDGRKNKSLFNILSCHNSKKFNLIIYKTKNLEEYLINSLKFKIENEQNI